MWSWGNTENIILMSFHNVIFRLKQQKSNHCKQVLSGSLLKLWFQWLYHFVVGCIGFVLTSQVITQILPVHSVTREVDFQLDWHGAWHWFELRGSNWPKVTQWFPSLREDITLITTPCWLSLVLIKVMTPTWKWDRWSPPLSSWTYKKRTVQCIKLTGTIHGLCWHGFFPEENA